MGMGAKNTGKNRASFFERGGQDPIHAVFMAVLSELRKVRCLEGEVPGTWAFAIAA